MDLISAPKPDDGGYLARPNVDRHSETTFGIYKIIHRVGEIAPSTHVVRTKETSVRDAAVVHLGDGMGRLLSI